MSINMIYIYIYIYVYIFFILFIIINPFTVTSKGDIHKHNGAFGTAPEALTGSWWHQLLRVESSMNQRDNDATYNPFFALWNCMTSLSWRRTSWTCMASLRRCLQAGKIVLWRTHVPIWWLSKTLLHYLGFLAGGGGGGNGAGGPGGGGTIDEACRFEIQTDMKCFTWHKHSKTLQNMIEINLWPGWLGSAGASSASAAQWPANHDVSLVTCRQKM